MLSKNMYKKGIIMYKYKIKQTKKVEFTKNTQSFSKPGGMPLKSRLIY